MLMHYMHHNNNKTLTNISNLFIPVREVNMYNTRFSSTRNLYVRNSHINNLKNSFSRAGVRIWNSIRDNLRNICKGKFKEKLQEILFSIFTEEEDYVDVPIIIKRIMESELTRLLNHISCLCVLSSRALAPLSLCLITLQFKSPRI